MGYRGVCLFRGSQTRPHASPFFFTKSYQSGSKMRAGDTRSGVNNFFVNTIVTALQESNWERLLGRCVPVPFRGVLHVSHVRH
jgi:hypothetical protein